MTRRITAEERRWRQASKSVRMRPMDGRATTVAIDDMLEHELKATLAWAMCRMHDAEKRR